MTIPIASYIYNHAMSVHTTCVTLVQVRICSCIFFYTAPSAPLNVTVLNKTSTSLLITWLPPTAPNGVVTSYEVYYRGVFSESLVPASFYQPLSITVYAPSTSLLLEGVFPYSNYTISVRAFTNAGPGEYSERIEDRTEEDGELTICCLTATWQGTWFNLRTLTKPVLSSLLSSFDANECDCGQQDLHISAGYLAAPICTKWNPGQIWGSVHGHLFRESSAFVLLSTAVY